MGFVFWFLVKQTMCIMEGYDFLSKKKLLLFELRTNSLSCSSLNWIHVMLWFSILFWGIPHPPSYTLKLISSVNN